MDHATARQSASAWRQQSVATLLRRLTEPQARLSRKAFAARRILQVALQGDNASLEFRAAPMPAVGRCVRLESDAGDLRLQLDSDDACATLAGRSWHDYEGDAQLLAWALVHERLLGFLEAAVGQSLQPTTVHANSLSANGDNDRMRVGFALREHGRRSALHGALELPGPLLEQILGRCSTQRTTPVNSRWRDLPLSLCVRYVGPVLRPDQLRQVNVGDVVVLGTRGHTLDNLVLVTPDDPALVFPCSGSADRLTITHRVLDSTDPYQETESMTGKTEQLASDIDAASTLDDAESPAPSAERGRAIDEIPITLEVGLGEVTLSLEELANLQPGYVLPLRSPVEGANVSLRVNRKIVGRGELIAAGDKLGVCVTNWGADGL